MNMPPPSTLPTPRRSQSAHGTLPTSPMTNVSTRITPVMAPASVLATQRSRAKAFRDALVSRRASRMQAIFCRYQRMKRSSTGAAPMDVDPPASSSHALSPSATADLPIHPIASIAAESARSIRSLRSNANASTSDRLALPRASPLTATAMRRR
jgi:hypothetical protein